MEDSQIDSRDWSPAEAFRAAALKADETDPSAGLAIMLYREGDRYDTAWTNSGLSLSEALSLLEVVKARMLRAMLPPE